MFEDPERMNLYQTDASFFKSLNVLALRPPFNLKSNVITCSASEQRLVSCRIT